MSTYSDQRTIHPKRINVKELHAKFLDEYVFMGRYPVVTALNRKAIKTPVTIVVDNPQDRLEMMGLNYHGGTFFSDPANPYAQSPSTTRGVLAKGTVIVQVVSTNPELRDLVMSMVLSAYMSDDSRCWFKSHQDEITYHGHFLFNKSETEFDATLDNKVNYLYVASIAMTHLYDIATTRLLGYIRDIKERVLVTVE